MAIEKNLEKQERHKKTSLDFFLTACFRN